MTPLDVLKVLVGGYLTYDFIRYIAKGGLRRQYAMFCRTSWTRILGLVGQSTVIFSLVLVAGALLWMAWPDVFGFSWLNLLARRGESGTNLMVAPAGIPYFGVFFYLLLMLNIPRLARIEEYRFRLRTRDWPHAVRRSIRFGLAHCIIGVPIGFGLAISIGGLWFSYQYFRGGIRRSILAHTVYNWTVLALLGGFAVYDYISG
ncbi:MAG: hypothetical protein K1X67_10190 [Fimbriimonadaceae bacterium]|nr:hypothetical protein [Fimbriimonadaceae bacterium]